MDMDNALEPSIVLQKLKAYGITCFETMKAALEAGISTEAMIGGIISKISATTKTANGTDFRTVLTLVEPSASYHSRHEIELTLFHTPTITPSKLKIGNIFLCRGVRAHKRFRNFDAMRTKPWAGYDVDSLNVTCDGNTKLEQDNNIKDILTLYQNWAKSVPPPSPPTSPTDQGKRPPQRGTYKRLIMPTEGMKEWNFIDYVGMVVDIFKQSPTATVLHLTDYTPNNKPLRLRKNEADSKLVPRELLIACTLYDENAKDCPHGLRFGDYVYIRNAKCKPNQTGTKEIVVAHDKAYSAPKIWRLETTDELTLEIQRLRSAYEGTDKRKLEEVTPSSPAKRRQRTKVYAVCPKELQDYSFVKDVILGDYETPHILRVAILDYKPKSIANISVKFCDTCGQSSGIDATKCRICDKNVDKIVYRLKLYCTDANGVNMVVSTCGTNEDPIFDKIPVVNLKENKNVCDDVAEYIAALCPPDRKQGPMLDMCVKAYVYDQWLRCMVENTKYQFEFEG